MLGFEGYKMHGLGVQTEAERAEVDTSGFDIVEMLRLRIHRDRLL